MIIKNVSLKKYNSFGLDYRAARLISFESEEKIISFLKDKKKFIYPLFIIGGGSNVLFTSDFKGTIIYPGIKGITVEEQYPGYSIISAGAGVSWDHFVEWSVNQGYGGLENLSHIPGLVGATPVQNIGAYGAEVKDTIIKIRTINISDGSIRIFSNSECKFGYRNSIFKNNEKGKYVVTRVYYKLTTDPVLNLNYGSLKDEADKLGGITLKNIRQAVINIRKSKLPDPEVIGNAGSFFKNPVVTRSVAAILSENYKSIPSFEDPSGGIKLAAGWLIEQCGWKGKKMGNAGVHEKQALVLVNLGKATGKEIYDLSELIKKSVFEKFGVELEREVEVIGSI